jgi:hypothetical protein
MNKDTIINYSPVFPVIAFIVVFAILFFVWSNNNDGESESNTIIFDTTFFINTETLETETNELETMTDDMIFTDTEEIETDIKEVETEYSTESTHDILEDKTKIDCNDAIINYTGGFDVDAYYIAKTIGVEAPYCSKMEQAAVAWCILNRVDDPRFPSTVFEVVTAPYQFAYFDTTPVRDDLYFLSLDVLGRWALERNGELVVGRTLPSEYLYFTGDGFHNYFRINENQGLPWDWSWGSPY